MAERVLHGVNLTGWLTLESWVTPEIFAGSGALDEPSLITALGERAYAEVVRRHRETFVTADDFARIAARGLNAVRLLVPWYVYGADGPNPGLYVGCIEHVDHALEWAEEYDIKVIFVLGIHPGNPSLDSEDDAVLDPRRLRERALDVVSSLSSRYASRVGFFGIELADEVTPQVRHGLTLTDGTPVHFLRNYYREAYELVRAAAGTDPVVIMPDGGHPTVLRRFMAQSRYVNVWLDCHLDRTSLKLDVTGPAGVRNLVAKTRGRIADAKRCGMPVMVGTWSASLPMPDSAMTPEGRIALERIYTSEQLGAYEKLPAWFFQTWKTSGLLVSWDARLALATFERGMLS